MPRMEDVYQGGVQVGLTCLECSSGVFTPVMEAGKDAAKVGLAWFELHRRYYYKHTLRAAVIYYA